VATHFGRTSLTLRCEVRNKLNHQPILTIEKLVFVNLGLDGVPAPHGKTQITYVEDRLNSQI
jgi:acyl-CoA thioesterase YciA